MDNLSLLRDEQWFGAASAAGSRRCTERFRRGVGAVVIESRGALQRTPDSVTIDRALIKDIALILLLWCISSIIVNPIGDFPLIDDFSYGRTVKHFVQTGDYRPLGWTEMTLITNVVWGSLFVLPSGFNFTALRLSTLLAALLGLIGCYFLIRDLQRPRWLALLVTLTLGFNPIYYALAHSFMTDVLFIAIAIWTAIFLARSLRSGSDAQMLVGAALAIVGTLSRQLTLCIPLAFAVTLLLREGSTPRTVCRALCPLGMCAIVLLAFNYWLSVSGKVPVLYGYHSRLLPQAFANLPHLLVDLSVDAFVTLTYLGLFLLPILLVSITNIPRSHAKKAMALAGFGFLTMALGAAAANAFRSASALYLLDSDDPILMPVAGHMLVKSGIGCLMLRDTFLLQLDHMPALPTAFWIAVTTMGIIGGALLIAKMSLLGLNLLPKLRDRCSIGDSEVSCLFLILCGILYLLPILPTGILFDRYLLLLIPFLAVGIVSNTGKASRSSNGIPLTLRRTASILLVCFSLYAIAGTRDYLTWNRVRWQALDDLTQQARVDPGEIDGGFEFNGLHFYDPSYQAAAERSFWWVHGDTYQIAFGPVPGYTVIKEYTYRHWMPPHEQKIVVLRKD